MNECKANARVKLAKTVTTRTLPNFCRSMYFLCCDMYFIVVLCIVRFVSFSVLNVCICVLYYCHRLATKLQLNISYHIYHIIYHFMSYHISFHILSYIISYRIIYHFIYHISYYIVSYIISYRIISYQFLRRKKFLLVDNVMKNFSEEVWSGLFYLRLSDKPH
jgi:hypothetical protein